MKKATKKKADLICVLDVLDDAGPLLAQQFYTTSDGGVEVKTTIGLGGNDLSLAGVLACGCHALLTAAEAPQELQDQIYQVMKQIESLVNVRAAAAQQKSRDKRDRGSLDDYPHHEDSDDLPF